MVEPAPDEIRIITLPRPLPHQAEVLLSPARYKVTACGRRWGKTIMGLLAVVQGHGPSPAALPGACDGGNIWWVAPTYGVAGKIWRDLKLACSAAWSDKSETERRIELPTGGSITVRSADRPDMLRGEGLDGLVLDEAAFVEATVWRDVLRPALSDRQGWAVFISTPNGRNWFFDLFQTAAGQPGWARWRRPTRENALILPEELESARQEVGPRAFAQEYLAEFTDIEGAEFSGEYFAERIWFDAWPSDLQIRLRVMAIDPSKGESEKSDYSAIVMLALDWAGLMWIDADLKRRDARRIVCDCLELARGFPPTSVGVEINQFQHLLAENLAEVARAQGRPLNVHGIHNTQNKRTRIRATLTPYLARGEFRFRRSVGGRLLVEQLQSFPLGPHDDGPDALEMAVRLARHVM